MLPQVLGDFWAYQLGLFYLYAIAALGLGVCWGRAGFLPLGQGLFFGSGLPLGVRADRVPESRWLLLLLPLAVCASGLLAFAIGVLVFRQRGESGPYFSIITLALALLAYQLANNWESVTGGFNGLKGIPGLPGLDSYTAAYAVAATALVAAALLVAWLYRAPLGVLWAALAQNERRVVMFGFDTDRLKAVAFGASGLLAGARRCDLRAATRAGDTAAGRLRALGRPRHLGRGRWPGESRPRARCHRHRRAGQRAARPLSATGRSRSRSSSSSSCSSFPKAWPARSLPLARRARRRRSPGR